MRKIQRSVEISGSTFTQQTLPLVDVSIPFHEVLKNVATWYKDPFPRTLEFSHGSSEILYQPQNPERDFYLGDEIPTTNFSKSEIPFILDTLSGGRPHDVFIREMVEWFPLYQSWCLEEDRKYEQLSQELETAPPERKRELYEERRKLRASDNEFFSLYSPPNIEQSQALAFGKYRGILQEKQNQLHSLTYMVLNGNYHFNLIDLESGLYEMEELFPPTQTESFIEDKQTRESRNAKFTSLETKEGLDRASSLLLIRELLYEHSSKFLGPQEALYHTRIPRLMSEMYRLAFNHSSTTTPEIWLSENISQVLSQVDQNWVRNIFGNLDGWMEPREITLETFNQTLTLPDHESIPETNSYSTKVQYQPQASFHFRFGKILAKISQDRGLDYLDTRLPMYQALIKGRPDGVIESGGDFIQFDDKSDSPPRMETQDQDITAKLQLLLMEFTGNILKKEYLSERRKHTLNGNIPSNFKVTDGELMKSLLQRMPTYFRRTHLPNDEGGFDWREMSLPQGEKVELGRILSMLLYIKINHKQSFAEIKKKYKQDAIEEPKFSISKLIGILTVIRGSRDDVLETLFNQDGSMAFSLESLLAALSQLKKKQSYNQIAHEVEEKLNTDSTESYGAKLRSIIKEYFNY